MKLQLAAPLLAALAAASPICLEKRQCMQILPPNQDLAKLSAQHLARMNCAMAIARI